MKLSAIGFLLSYSNLLRKRLSPFVLYHQEKDLIGCRRSIECKSCVVDLFLFNDTMTAGSPDHHILDILCTLYRDLFAICLDLVWFFYF